MEVRNSSRLVSAAAVAGLVLAGCGKASTDQASGVAPTLSGVVTSDAPATTVALRDASDPASVRIATPGADGSFSFDATGLAPPFVLRAEGMGPALYTIVLRSGNADINGLTSAAVAGAMGGADAGEAWSRWSDGEGGEDGEHDGAGRIGSVIQSLRTVLKPLFDLYHVGRIGGDDDEGDVSGMRALLHDVSFTVSDGVVTVTNRATGGVIFSGPLNDLASGVFHPENMPAGPGGTTPPPPPTACTYTYSAWGACQPDGTQTRTVVSATPAGCTGTPVLTQTCTPPPPPPVTCTGFTYSAWTPATCPASGQQTRTVVSATPAGCTGGNPVLTQTCTPPATNPVTTADVVSSCTMCHGLTSNNTVFKSGGYSKKGATSAQWLSTVNSMIGMGAALAPGTTAQNYADFLANAP